MTKKRQNLTDLQKRLPDGMRFISIVDLRQEVLANLRARPGCDEVVDVGIELNGRIPNWTVPKITGRCDQVQLLAFQRDLRTYPFYSALPYYVAPDDYFSPTH
jgi:hypothetical protein